MALSMEEQRILAEIEQHLARAEPALAAQLAAFGHPVDESGLHSPRIRILASFAVLIVIAVVSVVVYALVPLRAPDRGGTGRATPAPGRPSPSPPRPPAAPPLAPPTAPRHRPPAVMPVN